MRLPYSLDKVFLVFGTLDRINELLGHKHQEVLVSPVDGFSNKNLRLTAETKKGTKCLKQTVKIPLQ